MKVERNRIFISDLPETATNEAICDAFNEYGKVISVEIKERKELGTKNSSLFFAYINIDIDSKSLQQCFKDFSNEKWLGQYVYLQLARESFLDRLKRERDENPVTNAKANVSLIVNNGKIQNELVPKVNVQKVKKNKYNSFSELNLTDEDNVTENKKLDISKNEVREQNIIIKNNRGKTYDNNGLKIASVGKEPIVKIDKSKKKVEVNTSAANIKRLESLKNLKKSYQNQKSLVQAALSKIDIIPDNKIIFDDEKSSNQQQYKDYVSSKKALFENEESDEEFEGNFEVKEQFQGAEGQKLLQLQSKFKNDKRFTLDSRFLENDNGDVTNNTTPEDDVTLEEEKQKEYEILNEVLGKKITSFEKKPDSQKKVMLRFDPSQAEHSKFEVKREVVKEKKKRKRDDNLNEKKQEEKEMPEVSKEVFYKVTENLKDSLQEKDQFSLLSLFGKSDAQVPVDEDEKSESVKTVPKNSLVNEKNPFRYDSSDDEDETEQILNPENADNSENAQFPNEKKQRHFWMEPFFFKSDDYRLQEGFDFIEKMKSEEDKLEFTKLRRDLKEVVKAKIRNNQRRHKPFKKKLGGNKRKKMIRIKKAMKR